MNAGQGMGSKGSQAAVYESIMREVWEGIAARLASQGWEPEEQFPEEFADTLRRLPHFRALEHREEAMAEARFYMCGLRQACEAIGALRDSQEPLSPAWQSLRSEEKDWAHMAAYDGIWCSEWPDEPRVSKGVKGRVDRLRGLGNAIVPKIAELIGRLIVECEESCKPSL